jgi:hypothetical protein
MSGADIPAKLDQLAKGFDRIARPKHQRQKDPAA